MGLNDMRLTHIDRLIFVAVCGGVKTNTHTHTESSLLNSINCTTHLHDRPTNIGLPCFPQIEATCKVRHSAPLSFLHRLNELKAARKESQSIKSLRAWPSGVLGGQEEGVLQLYYCVLTCVRACVRAEGSVSPPLTVGACPASCTVKTRALNCFRHRALSNECDSNRSSWGHRH